MTDSQAFAVAGDDSGGHPSQWRAVAPSGWRVVQWEQDSSLFNDDSGETHLLGPLPAEVLSLVSRRPWTLAGLCAELAVSCGVPDDQGWSRKVAQMLAGLALLELIEPYQPLACQAGMSSGAGVSSDYAAVPL